MDAINLPVQLSLNAFRQRKRLKISRPMMYIYGHTGLKKECIGLACKGKSSLTASLCRGSASNNSSSTNPARRIPSLSTPEKVKRILTENLLVRFLVMSRHAKHICRLLVALALTYLQYKFNFCGLRDLLFPFTYEYAHSIIIKNI